MAAALPFSPHPCLFCILHNRRSLTADCKTQPMRTADLSRASSLVQRSVRTIGVSPNTEGRAGKLNRICRGAGAPPKNSEREWRVPRTALVNVQSRETPVTVLVNGQSRETPVTVQQETVDA